MANNKFHRIVLPTAEAFRQFLSAAENPKFGMTHGSEDENEFFNENEWVFANDHDTLMLEVLGWDKRGCYFEYHPPTTEEIECYGDDIEGHWKVIGLPDYFNEWPMPDPVPSDGILPTQEEMRAKFFAEIIKRWTESEFFFLRSQSYQEYLQNWEEEVV
jgi:hypothetical protein